jgi:hypothetical protein
MMSIGCINSRESQGEDISFSVIGHGLNKITFFKFMHDHRLGYLDDME